MLFNKYILFIFFVVVACSTRESQIESDQQGDTLVVYLQNLVYEDVDSAYRYSKYLLKTDDHKNNIKKRSAILNSLASSCFLKGRIDTSIFYFNKIVGVWEKDSSKLGREQFVKSLFNLAYANQRKGNYTKSLNQLEKALEIAENQKLHKYILNICMSLSKAYCSIEKYDLALGCIEKSIYASKKVGDTSLIISSIQSYADAFTNFHLFDEAEKQFSKVEHLKSYHTDHSKFNFYLSRGRMYYLKENYNKAIGDFLVAKQNANRDDIIDFLIVLNNLTETYLYLEKLDSAKMYLDSIAKHKNIIERVPLFKYNYNSLFGDFYSKKEKYKRALNCFRISDSIGETDVIDKVVVKLHQKRKIDYFHNIGDYENAFECQFEYNKLNKNIQAETDRMQAAGIEYKYKRDTTILSQNIIITQKENELEEYKLREVFYIVLIFVFSILLLFIILYYRKKKQLDYQKNVQRIAALKMESLRSRLSPHFLFNVLNNIWATLEKRDVAKMQYDNLVFMIRKSLLNCEKMAISINEEINFVSRFVEIEQQRVDGGFEVEWSIDDKLDFDYLVPSMILQIPVENAIKHGLMKVEGKRVLKISIIKDTNFISIKVIDNGKGYRHNSLHNREKEGIGTGTGLKVLASTIHLLNVKNDRKISYHINSMKDPKQMGTEFLINIPVVYNYNLN